MICKADLVFRALPDAIDPSTFVNGQPRDSSSRATRGGSLMVTQAAQAGVTTLFHVEPDETVKERRDIGPDRSLFITTKRVVLLDVNALLEGERA